MDMKNSPDSAMKFEVAPALVDEPSIIQAESRGLWSEIKAHGKIVGFCIGLVSTALLAGYDTVVIGTITALPYFQKDFGELYGTFYIIPSLWLSLWSVMTPLGQMGGAVVGGWVQDRLGRRLTILVGGIFSAISIAICYVSAKPHDIDTRRGVFLVGKALLGIALGMMLTTTQTYMSEVTPRTIRGPILGLIPTGILLGQLVGAVVIWSQSSDLSSNSYLISIASQWPLSVVPMLVALILPESPTWLVRTKRDPLALKSLTRLHNSPAEAQQVLEKLTAVIAEEEAGLQDKDSTYVECFKGTDRRRTWILILASIIPIIFGLPVLGQASYSMQIVGMEAGISLIVLILGIALGFIANGIGLWVMSKVGRRKLILVSLGLSTFLWLGMGISGFWPGTVNIWYSSATLMCVVVVNGLGSWPASYAVGGEVSSLRLRGKSQGIGWFANSLVSCVVGIILPYIFNPDAGNLRSKTGFVLAGFCAVGVGACWLMVPEMRHRSNAEIDRMFTVRLPTRAFKTWTSDEDARVAN